MIREQDRKAWRKFKIQLTVIMAAALSATIYCNSAHAATINVDVSTLDKPYAITILKKYDVACVWTRNEYGNLSSENAAYEGTGVCWDATALADAEKKDKEGKLKWISNEKSPEELLRSLLSDSIAACEAGMYGTATGNWKQYTDILTSLLSKYGGNAGAIDRIGTAYEYGRLMSRSKVDCINYVMY
ncbi:hypothetical protein [Klebsiella phage BUCT_47333]|jgi:hypothetical protein|uniref:Uncharacterized protein n=2 Tax=Jameshumphriesvirinae TaxID=3152215 RepID=A0AAE7V7G5_9CAUD|nr:hypothetical protein PQZ57_gp25 [Klebsiella phage BUCT_47333]QXG78623.1 hypothetical protein [Klebsiella phage BUCT_47333]